MKLKYQNESLKNPIFTTDVSGYRTITRSKTITSPDPRDKPCVICNHVKCQGKMPYERFRIESSEVADRLLKVANFNKDEIHIRLIFPKEIGVVWEKDIMYHNNCMNKYISKFACQELIKICKFGGRGKIPETFSPGDEIDLSWKKNEFSKQYRLWIKSPVDDEPHIPSFAAVKSLLDSSTHFIAKCAFSPILPYPVTEYDAIFTAMINFQDMLKQKERENSPLWSDEGVHHAAKEILLLYPQKFSIMFLGIGGFHLEKVVIGCLGTYLESSGIQNLLVEEKVYGPGVVNSVMSGGNYIRGKRGMSLIAEAMEQLQVYSFLQSSDGVLFSELFDKIDELIMMRDPSKNQVNITSQWSKCMNILDKFEEAFNTFKTSSFAESNLFAYWNNFLSNMAPVLRDLTRSFRDADWYLHLSSVSRA